MRGVFEEQFMGTLERAVFGEGEPDAFIWVVAESFDGFLWSVGAMREGAANVQRVTQGKALDDIPWNQRALGEFQKNLLIVACGESAGGLNKVGRWPLNMSGNEPEQLGKVAANGRLGVIGEALPGNLRCFYSKKVPA